MNKMTIRTRTTTLIKYCSNSNQQNTNSNNRRIKKYPSCLLFLTQQQEQQHKNTNLHPSCRIQQQHLLLLLLLFGRILLVSLFLLSVESLELRQLSKLSSSSSSSFCRPQQRQIVLSLDTTSYRRASIQSTVLSPSIKRSIQTSRNMMIDNNNDHDGNSIMKDDTTSLLSKQQSTTASYNSVDEEFDNNESTISDKDNNNNNNNNSNRKSIGQEILDLALPAGAALLIDPIMNVVDTVFVGRYYADDISANPLAGMGSAIATITFCFYLCNFLCTATTPLVAQRRVVSDNNNNSQQLSTTSAIQIGGQALSLSFVLGITLIVLLSFFGPTILYNVMGTSYTGDSSNQYALDFISVRKFAAPAVLCIEASIGILRGYYDTRTPIVVLILANIINFILDVVLIIYPFHLGPQGAAIATTVAEWISAGLFLGILAGYLPSAAKNPEIGSNQKLVIASTNEVPVSKINYDDSTSSTNNKVSIVPLASIPSFEDIQPLLVASSAVFARSLVLQVSLSAAAAMAARSGGGSGGAAMASHQIGVQLWMLCSFFCDSLAAASQGMIATSLGQQDPIRVRDISKTIFLYSIYLGIFLAIVLQIGLSTGLLLNFFTQDDLTKASLSSILPLIIVAQPLNALVFAADGVLQGGSQFPYQARAMAASGITAVLSFVALQAASISYGSSDFLGTDTGSTTLVHVWIALLVLQFMRGLTSLWKIIDPNGPIDILDRKTV